MEYRIVLTRMEFHALHGCYELERKVGNRFTVDLELTAELGHAATDDDVRKTVNYLTAYEVVEMQMRITQHTIERVATNIIEAVYATFPQVRHIRRCSQGVPAATQSSHYPGVHGRTGRMSGTCGSTYVMGHRRPSQPSSAAPRRPSAAARPAGRLRIDGRARSLG